MAFLRERTIEEFGYDPLALAQFSHKLVYTICEGCGKIRVRPKSFHRPRCISCTITSEGNPFYHKNHTKEARRKMRENHADFAGENNTFYGKHHTEETKIKISNNRVYLRGKAHPSFGKPMSEEAKKKMIDAQIGLQAGEKNAMFGKHHTKEALEKMKKARRHQHFPKHHTKPELIFEEICKKYDLHFKYVGDGSLWIGKDRALNPDFIQADGQKIVVEIFGDWWHSPLLNPKLSETANLNFRKRHYKKFKWHSIFIWETDLVKRDAEEFVLNLLEKEGMCKK